MFAATLQNKMAAPRAKTMNGLIPREQVLLAASLNVAESYLSPAPQALSRLNNTGNVNDSV